MLPFGVAIPATVPQGSEIPEGLMNNPVFIRKCKTLSYNWRWNGSFCFYEWGNPVLNVPRNNRCWPQILRKLSHTEDGGSKWLRNLKKIDYGEWFKTLEDHNWRKPPAAKTWKHTQKSDRFWNELTDAVFYWTMTELFLLFTGSVLALINNHQRFTYIDK
jgi:hypothetical protein